MTDSARPHARPAASEARETLLHEMTHLLNEAVKAVQDGERTEALARLGEIRELHHAIAVVAEERTDARHAQTVEALERELALHEEILYQRETPSQQTADLIAGIRRALAADTEAGT